MFQIFFSPLDFYSLSWMNVQRTFSLHGLIWLDCIPFMSSGNCSAYNSLFCSALLSAVTQGNYYEGFWSFFSMQVFLSETAPQLPVASACLNCETDILNSALYDLCLHHDYKQKAIAYLFFFFSPSLRDNSLALSVILCLKTVVSYISSRLLFVFKERVRIAHVPLSDPVIYF